MTADALPQAAMHFQSCCKRGVIRHGALHPSARYIVEFTINPRDQHGLINVGHAASPSISIKAPRPLTSRDVNVPIGTPKIPAASL